MYLPRGCPPPLPPANCFFLSAHCLSRRRRLFIPFKALCSGCSAGGGRGGGSAPRLCCSLPLPGVVCMRGPRGCSYRLWARGVAPRPSYRCHCHAPLAALRPSSPGASSLLPAPTFSRVPSLSPPPGDLFIGPTNSPCHAHLGAWEPRAPAKPRGAAHRSAGRSSPHTAVVDGQPLPSWGAWYVTRLPRGAFQARRQWRGHVGGRGDAGE